MKYIGGIIAAGFGRTFFIALKFYSKSFKCSEIPVSLPLFFGIWLKNGLLCVGGGFFPVNFMDA